MGTKTGIAWADHTFNPWWGCAKVSAACTNCYAEALDRRLRGGGHWGALAPRQFFGDKHWRQPVGWDVDAKRAGERRRVFCASMADVFERHAVREIDARLVAERGRLFDLIRRTQHLDWMLLTKRPEHIAEMITGPLPRNVWLGATAEDQDRADERIPLLVGVPAEVHFLSVEPMLGPIDLARWSGAPIDWVIAGCESGPRRRESVLEVEWYRSLREQCAARGIAFFLKQAAPRDGITHGDGSWIKREPGGAIIEQPYLDGAQHVAHPRSR